MSNHPDSEDALEIATLERLVALGWAEWANCYQETATNCHITGRDSRADVVLAARLGAALERLNPHLPDEALEQASAELLRDRSAMSLANANREVISLLKEGAPVSYRREGEETLDRARIIDWDNPAANDFLLAQQLWITGPHHTRRPDLVGFVNGLPLLLVELKKPSVNLKHAFDDNLRDYKDTIPALFWYNGVIALSNGSDARLGSLTAEWDHFAGWKKINSEGERGVIRLDTLLQATCTPQRLLDLVENFTVFSEGRGGTIKIVAKNHQYLGVNNAIAAVHDIEANRGRLGVFWHTQGSGKSYSMLFFSQKILRKVPGNWTFVVLTDRRDLDDQIYKTFANAGAVTEPENAVRAQSGDHLQQLLQEDHRYVFSLIHKFHIERGQTYPALSERSDIIVMTDEAHRSQYDILAQNMRNALPKAAFIGFTGTPLMAGEEKTREVFGDYVSVYNFRQSIEDQATVALYYENRIPEVQIINEQFDRDLERILEEAELDEAAEARLEREFAHEYHIITRDDRLEKIAADIVQHFIGRGYRGKAMVVSVDKVTAGRMHDKVQRHWQLQLAALRADLESLATDDPRYAETAADVTFMAETDMALVISQGQNEIAQFKAKGLDILPHRGRMNNEPLDEQFKNPAHPLRIVFVCAMWMTGFDAPSCSTIYLDKPMRNHTLMQTIARANRVYSGKNNGLIVDYIGVFRNLQEALAIYGATRTDEPDDGDRPIKPKEALLENLSAALEEVRQYSAGNGADLDAIADSDDSFERLALIEGAVEGLLVNDDTKNGFLAHANLIGRLFKAILPDRRANQFLALYGAVKAIRDKIQMETEPPDISGVMGQVEALLDRSIAVEGFVIREKKEEPFNLSRIDFDALAEQFRRGRKHTEAARLRARLSARIAHLVRLNKSRAELARQFEALVAAYNAGIIDVDEFFERLLAFIRELQEEEQRGIAENLTEEELALFDILLKPRPELAKPEIEQVKAVARQLLDVLKREKLILDWRKRIQARSAVRQTIETILDTLPEKYGPDLWGRKCDQVYAHVYDSYYGDGQSVYANASESAVRPLT